MQKTNHCLQFCVYRYHVTYNLFILHFSSPSHPLIHAFLLGRADFSDKRSIIVETPKHAKELLKNIEGLKELFPKRFTHQYRYIATELDALEMAYDESIIGIYSLPLPEYFDVMPESK